MANEDKDCGCQTDPTDEALTKALSSLTDRERAILEAGMLLGSAQVLSEVNQQHLAFIKVTQVQSDGRRTAGVKVLIDLDANRSPASKAGTETATRIVNLVRSILGSR